MAKRLPALGCGLALTLCMGTAVADVVVVVSADSSVKSLTRNELSDIYLGRLTRFPGGGRVVPLDQREGSPSHDEFYEEFLGRSPAQIKAHWSKLIFTGRGQPPRTVPDGGAMVDVVSSDPSAIGYVDDAIVTNGVRILPIE